MKVYFLVSLHMLGAEQFCKALVCDYKPGHGYSAKFGTKLDVSRNDVEIVVFGSKDRLNALDSRSITKTTIESDYKNRFVVAATMKSFVESSVFPPASSQDDKKVYVVTDLMDEDYWETPNNRTIKPYLKLLIFLSAQSASLHELFGCGVSCSVRCSHCYTTYQKCDATTASKHTTLVISGRCLNNDCGVAIMQCQKGTYADHASSHPLYCRELCGRKESECNSICNGCNRLHCKYIDDCFIDEKERIEKIARCECPVLGCRRRKTMNRRGLEAHFQTCVTQSELFWVHTCSCGIHFIDKEHEKFHRTLKKCKNCVTSVRTPPRIYDASLYYRVSDSPAPSVLTPISPIVDVFGSELISTIYTAFSVENSPLYTLSVAETSHIKSVTAVIDAILRMSRIVSSVIGFGSADKKTGVPGFVDVDLLVSINNYDPAKRQEYATSFRALLQEAGANLKESAHDIQQLEYKGVEFDLVLIGTDARDNDKRAKDFAEARTNVQGLRAVVGTNNYVLETIRAAKYWSKRSLPAGGIKSCLIEAIVLAHFAAQTTALAELVTQKKRRVKLFELFLAYVANSTPPVLSETVTELSTAGPVTPEQRAAAKTALEALQRMG